MKYGLIFVGVFYAAKGYYFSGENWEHLSLQQNIALNGKFKASKYKTS